MYLAQICEMFFNKLCFALGIVTVAQKNTHNSNVKDRPFYKAQEIGQSQARGILFIKIILQIDVNMQPSLSV